MFLGNEHLPATGPALLHEAVRLDQAGSQTDPFTGVLVLLAHAPDFGSLQFKNY